MCAANAAFAAAGVFLTMLLVCVCARKGSVIHFAAHVPVTQSVVPSTPAS